jgi:polysaccharide transporter, PST family
LPPAAPHDLPPPATDVDRSAAWSQIKRSSVRGGAVTGIAQAASALIQIVSTVTLARLLTPEEYGAVAMVLAVTVFAGLFRDLGLSASTIQRAQLSHAQLSTLFWLNVAAGTALTGLVAAAAPLVAWFYGRPELTAVTLALSVTFVIGSFGTQPGALLSRQLRFGRRAAATLAGAVVTFLTSLTLAWQGFSYWALVVGTIAGGLTTTVLLNLLCGWRPGLPSRRAGIRPMVQYGLNLTGFDLANYFSRNLDNILIGRFAGADALGLYSRAYALLMFPISNLRAPVGAVAFPALSRLQDQPADFRHYYRTVVFMLAAISMPVVALVFVLSDVLILVALGPRWVAAAELFSILALAAFLQPTSGLRGTVLMSLGLGRRYLSQGVIAAVVTSAGFVIGIQWDATGVAWAYVTTSLLLVFPMHVYCFRGTPVAVGDYFGTIALPAAVSIGAGAVTAWVHATVGSALPPVAQLLLGAGVFGVTYTIPFALHRPSRSRLARAWRVARERDLPTEGTERHGNQHDHRGLRR